MIPVHSAQTIRDAEQLFFATHPGIDLMGRAAAGVALAAAELIGSGGRILVVVGPGNNGGDGLFAAAQLGGQGYQVQLWLAAGRCHEEGLAAALAAGAVVVDFDDAQGAVAAADLVIDAYTGIRGRPGLPQDVALVSHACRQHGVLVLAVDIPSGLDADAPELGECFRANRTVTFASLKLAHVAQPAAGACGGVEVVDIGLQLPEPGLLRLADADFSAWWPAPGPTDDKYSRGVLRLDTGSAAYPGAAVLGALGATHSGAGMVRYVGPARDLVLQSCPSVVCHEGRVQAQAVGSGWGGPDPTRLAKAVSIGVPTVFDAEALIGLPESLPNNSLLTPHAGELARLLDVSRAEVEADPLGAATEAALRHQCAVLIKGATQYVAFPGSVPIVVPPGTAWLAQAGSGDVLAGVAGTLLAAGLPAQRAGALAAALQALASQADVGPTPPGRLAERFSSHIGLVARNRTNL